VRGRHGDTEDRVRAEVLLRRRAVEPEHLAVDGRLLGRIQADELRRDLRVDVLDRLEHALAAVLALVAVAQLERLMLARARAGGNDGAAARTVLQVNFSLKGGVAPRIEDLAGDDFGDGGATHTTKKKAG
jgi:hypothetical protein